MADAAGASAIGCGAGSCGRQAAAIVVASVCDLADRGARPAATARERHGAGKTLHTDAPKECARDYCAARCASPGDRRAEAGELCNGDGCVRRESADTGAAGYQGLPGGRELDCDDWRVSRVADR